jgi:hypothetical protein
MSHIIHVKLEEGFTDGLFVIQPDWNVKEFRQLIHDKLAPELHSPTWPCTGSSTETATPSSATAAARGSSS